MTFKIIASALLYLVVGKYLLKYSLRDSKGIAKLNFSASDYFLFFFMTSCVLLAGVGVASLIENSFYGRTDWSVFVPTAALQIFAIISVFIFGRCGTFGKLDFFEKMSWADVFCGVKFFLLSLTIMPLAMIFSYCAISEYTGAPPVQQDVIEVFRTIKDPKAYALAVFSVVVLAPISEELFFRGLLYRILRDGFFGGVWWNKFNLSPKVSAGAAAFSVALLFAYIHFNTYAFLPLLTMGLLFVACYAKRGSIVSAIVLHSLFNTLNMSILIIASIYGDV